MGNILKKQLFISNCPSTDTTRIITPTHLPGQSSPPSLCNKIRTSKYTPLTFIPKNLFEQFHRLANIYFVFIVVLNWVPQINAFDKEVAMIPLVFVLSVTAIKDAFEDFQRRQSDRRINGLPCRVYSKEDRRYVRKRWEQVAPGDLLHLSCDEVIPADIVLLSSSDEGQICFIDTANIDGESNLKQRCAVSSDFRANAYSPLLFTHRIQVEAPNEDIHRFHGLMLTGLGEKQSVAKDNLLLRGCIVKNTDYVEGIAIYTGHDTKAMMNNRGARHKRSKVEVKINRDILWCVILLLAMCFSCAIGTGLWLDKYDDGNSLFAIVLDGQSHGYVAFLNFWTYIILFQVMIPLPLYVTIELVKLAQIYFVHQDVELLDESSAKRVRCRALNITEDLGQVQYIFADKTGTLTENKMVFKQCSIGGVCYGDAEQVAADLQREALSGGDAGLEPASPTGEVTLVPQLTRALSHMSLGTISSCEPASLTQLIHEFFLVMTICNTVVVAAKPHNDKMDAVGVVHDESVEVGTSVSDILARINPLSLIRSNSAATSFDVPRADDASSGASAQCDGRFSRLEESIVGKEEGVHYEARGMHYEAESPDELALVKGAGLYGCRLVHRSARHVKVRLPGVRDPVTLEVLHVLPFDSSRKRMSVITRHPGTRAVVLYCKGADGSILTRLAAQQHGDVVDGTSKHLVQFAKFGHRTLCFARRVLPEHEYQAWLSDHKVAENSFEDRESRLARSYDAAESGLELLGASAVEDRLQAGVPEALAALRAAHIQLWMLTGDKQETALNVASSSQLFGFDQHIIALNARSTEMARDLLLSRLEASGRHRLSNSSASKPALIVDGKTLGFVFDERLQAEFLALVSGCSAVVCCRATPIQKAAVVKLVQRSQKKLTLAIGDGANDVCMLQTANIGIGISGQEGMQAVMASDFSMPSFCYLHRLLFVHGHWAYDRLTAVTLYMFYKNAVFIFLLLWFQLFSGFSGQTPLDDLNLIFFNLIYTSIPPFVVGVFDQDVSSSVLSRFPLLYDKGRLSLCYRRYSYFVEILDALWQSLIQFFVTYLAYYDSTVGVWEFGFTVHACCTWCALLHICIETHHWNVVHVSSISLSLLLFYGINVAFNVVCVSCVPPDSFYHVVFHALSSARHWLVLVLAVVIALAPRYLFHLAKNIIRPSHCFLAKKKKTRGTNFLTLSEGSQPSIQLSHL